MRHTSSVNDSRTIICRLVTLLVAAILCLPACKSREERIEEEFRKLYKFDLSDVGGALYARRFELKNKSGRDWKRIFVIINPPNPNSDLWNAIKFEVSPSGFRAPKEPGKIYVSLPAGEIMKIPIKEFTHTETREIFSRDRYDVDRVYIRVAVPYQGEEFLCDITLVF